MGGAQIDFDTKSEKVAQIGVQGATPVPNLISHFLKSEKKHPKLRAGGRGGNLGNGRIKLCFYHRQVI